MKEIWQSIPGYESLYEASNLGRIKSKFRILSPSKNRKGYLVVSLSKEKTAKLFFVHRLVTAAFFGNIPKFMEVNHIDGNKENNVIENLEYCSSSQNKKHAYATGLKKPSNVDRRGYLSPNGKQVNQYSLDGVLIGKFGSARDAARMVGVRYQNIVDCCAGKQKTSANSIWRYDPTS